MSFFPPHTTETLQNRKNVYEVSKCLYSRLIILRFGSYLLEPLEQTDQSFHKPQTHKELCFGLIEENILHLCVAKNFDTKVNYTNLLLSHF